MEIHIDAHTTEDSNFQKVNRFPNSKTVQVSLLKNLTFCRVYIRNFGIYLQIIALTPEPPR